MIWYPHIFENLKPKKWNCEKSYVNINYNVEIVWGQMVTHLWWTEHNLVEPLCCMPETNLTPCVNYT